MTGTVNRGYHPDDSRLFSSANLSLLRFAHQDLVYLLDRGYSDQASLTAVGNHYQLSSRQRMALMRTAASNVACIDRRRRLLDGSAVHERHIQIDGFNLIITLETALSCSLLLRGDDLAIRDLACLRGSYRIIERTKPAIRLVLEQLDDLKANSITFWLDRPVSNSGRLRNLILEEARRYDPVVQVQLVANPDTVLFGKEMVVSSDSVVLDRCTNWINLAADIINQKLEDVWIVSLQQD